MASLLPVELYDEIISYLWDDKTALAACSLTSRGLTIPSQSLLFCQIILISPDDLDLSISSGRTASSFWNNVLKKSPHIAGYVQCLQVFNDINYNYQSWVCHDTFLPKILPLHTRLKALVVFKVEWDSLSADMQRAFQDVVRLPSLVHLDTSCSGLAVRVSPHFSDNLKRLVVHYNYPGKALQSGPSEAHVPPIYLESFNLVETASVLVPLNLDFRFKHSHLRKLAVNMGTELGQFVKCRQLSPVLLSCRETLEELQLTLHITLDLAVIHSRRVEPDGVSQSSRFVLQRN